MVINRRGMTLMEMIIVVAILGVVAIVAPTLLTKSTQMYVLGKTKLELQREARMIMYNITRELRQAQSSTLTIDQVTGQPYYSRLRFTKAQGSSITLRQQGKSLIFSEGVVVSTMTQNLSYLSFTFPRSDDMTIISVAITLQQQIYGGGLKALHMASEKVRVMN